MTAARLKFVVAVLCISGCGEWPHYPAARIPQIERAIPETSASHDAGGEKSGDISTESTARKPIVLSPPPDLLERPQRSGPSLPAPGTVMLDFEDADIRDVIAVILGDTLKLNYVVEQGVNGRVSIRTQRGFRNEDLIPVLESLLAINDAALVRESSGLYRVTTRDKARSGIPSVGRRGGEALLPGYQTRVISLRYMSASELLKILQPFASAQLALQIDDRRNVLFIAGSGADISKLEDLIGVFDVDWLAGKSIGLFPVSYARPEQLVDELNTLLSGEQGEQKSTSNALIKLIPIERIGSILAVSSQPEYLVRVQEWITRLDQPEDSETRRLFVYRIENGKASDLAGVLNQIFVSIGWESGQLPAGSVAPGLTPLEVTSVSTATDVLGGLAPGQTSPMSAGVGAGIRIIADERNNALVLLATAREYRMVVEALRKLDVTPMQVLIEASIIEVSLTDDLRYGVEWFFKNNVDVSGDKQGRGLLDLGGPGIGPVVPGFSYALVDAADRVRAAINMLASQSDVNVLSSPTLMVLGNQKATINVGDEVPVPTRQSVSNVDPDAPTVNEIQYRDTGVILEVTPRLNAGGLVTMEVAQEVSDVGPTTTSGIDAPTFQQRKIESTVAIQSGNTIVLGGLIRDRKSTGESGVPVIGRVPYIGKLFSATNNEARRTELLVLITPRSVSSAEQATGLTEEYRRKLESLSVGTGERINRIPP